MPDQFGRPQMSDWTSIMQSANAMGEIQDKAIGRRDRQGVEKALGIMSSQQETGIALEDMKKPADVSERQWATALASKYNIAAMDEQQKAATYSRWAEEFQKNKAEAQKSLALLKEQRETSVPENQRKEAILDFYNKHVYDNQRYTGTETKQDGSVVHIFENPVTGKRIEQPDATADEMLWAADDYVNRWFDKTAPAARSKRIEKNMQGLLNPIEMVNGSGDTVFLYEQVKRGSDGYEPVVVRKNPTKDVDKQDPKDFIETSISEWVAKGYKVKPKLDKNAMEAKKFQIEASNKKSDQIRKSMDFIANQLGVVPKKGSNDDLMALAVGDDEQIEQNMPTRSTLKGILNKMEGGSAEEKALATSWMQMAGELYPGLKNIQNNNQQQAGGNGEKNMEANNAFALSDADTAEIISASQLNKDKNKNEQEAVNSKKSVEISKQLPGLSESINRRSQQQEYAPTSRYEQRHVLSMKEAMDLQNWNDSRNVDAQHPGFSESLNRYYPQQDTAINMAPDNKGVYQVDGGIPMPQNLPAPFQYNPDREALNMISANRPRR